MGRVGRQGMEGSGGFRRRVEGQMTGLGGAGAGLGVAAGGGALKDDPELPGLGRWVVLFLEI